MVDRDYLTVSEARDLLGISKPRMAQMLRQGLLVSEPNPADRRSKLLLRDEVEALARNGGKKMRPG